MLNSNRILAIKLFQRYTTFKYYNCLSLIRCSHCFHGFLSGCQHIHRTHNTYWQTSQITINTKDEVEHTMVSCTKCINLICNNWNHPHSLSANRITNKIPKSEWMTLCSSYQCDIVFPWFFFIYYIVLSKILKEFLRILFISFLVFDRI